MVAFLLALHGPGGVGIDEIDGIGGPGRPVLRAAEDFKTKPAVLTATRTGTPQSPQEEAVSVPAPILAPCGNGCAFGAGSQ